MCSISTCLFYFNAHVWKETVIDSVLLVNSVLWLRMKSMGTAVPAPWATLALIVDKAIVIPHHAAMEQPAYLSVKATNVSVITDSR